MNYEYKRKNIMKYTVYCDGSYQSSINSGGWSSVILRNGEIIKLLYRGYKNTTNNRMELMAVIETLKYFKEPTEIEIYSDSQYVVNSITRGSVYKWFEEKDFSKKNLDLWFTLIDLLEIHKVTFNWVKGHNTSQLNNLADKLAVHAAQCLNLLNDGNNTTSI